MSAERRTGRARREIPQNSRHTKQELAQTQIFQPRKNQKTKSVTKLIDDTQESRKQKAREAKIALAPIKKKSTPQ